MGDLSETSDSLDVIAACLALPIVERRIAALIKEGQAWGNNAAADKARIERDAKLKPLQKRSAQLLSVIYGR